MSKRQGRRHCTPAEFEKFKALGQELKAKERKATVTATQLDVAIRLLRAAKPSYPWAVKHHCGDCGVIEGELHQEGCQHEVCPVCGGQAISCDCAGELCEAKHGRVPYVAALSVCSRCGKLQPEYYMAGDWDDVIPHPLKHKELCISCYLMIREWMLAARRERREQEG